MADGTTRQRGRFPRLTAWLQLTGLWWAAFFFGLVAASLWSWNALVLGTLCIVVGAGVAKGRVYTPWPRGGVVTGLFSLACVFLLFGASLFQTDPKGQTSSGTTQIATAPIPVFEAAPVEPSSPANAGASAPTNEPSPPGASEQGAGTLEPAKAATETTWAEHEEWSKKLSAIESAVSDEHWETALSLHRELPKELGSRPGPQELDDLGLSGNVAGSFVKRYRRVTARVERKTAAILDDAYESLWGARDPDAVNEDAAISNVAQMHDVSVSQVEAIWFSNQDEVLRRLQKKSLRQDRARKRAAGPRGPHIRSGYALGCVTPQLHDEAGRVAAAGGDPRSVRGCVRLGQNTEVSLVGSEDAFASLVRVRLNNGRRFWTATENVAK